MFFKIAIVQNEKEVFKYDCADWSKILYNIKDFDFYQKDYFDEHNINSMFENICEYDAVFFATNALNADAIYNSCILNSSQIESFIKDGHGFFVGYSSKNKKREFLPKRYAYSQIERDFQNGESEHEGEIVFIDQGIHNLFVASSCEQYIENSKNHSTISGLYFDYLDIDSSKTFYDIIIEDISKSRPLLCSSKKTTSEKVVISTLPIDWQGQTNLFINIVRFCTEGIPLICLVSKYDLKQHINFSYQYLCRQLNYHKKSFVLLSCNSALDFFNKSTGCNVFIFDPSWTENEIAILCKENSEKISKQNLRILHYYQCDNIGEDTFFKLTIHSAYQEIDILEKQLVFFLESNIPDIKQKYSYDSSLIATYEAIKLLKKYGVQNEKLNANIVEQGIKRLLSDGSYDAMFIASCTFLSLWTICENEKICKQKYDLLKEYVLNKITKDFVGISVYEKAQALTYLHDVVSFPTDFISRIVCEVINLLQKTEGQELMSFGVSNCWKLLTADIYIEEAIMHHKEELMQLIKKQVQVFSGNEINVKPVIVANYVRAISSLLSKKISLEPKELQYVYQSLFSAVAYLNDVYKDIQFNDIYSSCTILMAMNKFYSLSMYPIDELLSLIEAKTESSLWELSKINVLLEISSSQAVKITEAENKILLLQNELTDSYQAKTQLEIKIDEMKKNEDKRNSQISELNNELKTQQSKNKHKSLTLVWVLLLCGLFISLFVWFAFFVVNNDSEFFKLLWSFIKKKAWPLLVVIVGWPISAFIQSNIDFFFKKNSDE